MQKQEFILLQQDCWPKFRDSFKSCELMLHVSSSWSQSSFSLFQLQSSSTVHIQIKANLPATNEQRATPTYPNIFKLNSVLCPGIIGLLSIWTQFIHQDSVSTLWVRFLMHFNRERSQLWDCRQSKGQESSLGVDQMPGSPGHFFPRDRFQALNFYPPPKSMSFRNQQKLAIFVK